MSRRSRRTVLALIAVCCLGQPFTHAIKAQVTFATAADLATIGGSQPLGGLVRGADGALYGTTAGGGAENCGIVYRLTTDGTLSLVHSFTRSHGCYPVGDLTLGPGGSLYGVTYYGGDTHITFFPGLGTVFKVLPNGTGLGTFTLLRSFPGAPGGTNPYGTLTLAPNGLLYGSATGGSGIGGGLIFTIDPQLPEPDNFAIVANGVNSQAALTLGLDGFLYGTTWIGNFSAGTVFRMPLNGAPETLYSFPFVPSADPRICPEGMQPLGELIEAADGHFYGSTSTCGPNPDDAGTIFRITSAGDLTTLHVFSEGASPGVYPGGAAPWGGMTLGNDGNLYGATTAGGDSGNGILYRVTPGETPSFEILRSFSGLDGQGPQEGRLLEVSPGVFYGTSGGGPGGSGQVFKLSVDVNSAPVAQNGTLATVEDVAFNGTLTATDIDDDPLTLTIVTNGTLGSVVVTDAATGAFTYTPNANVSGEDTFTFRANDGPLDSNLATVTVTITPINDAPVAIDASITTDENTPISGTLSASDAEGQALTFSILSNGTRGTPVITDSATGAFTYTPNANVSGADSFTFQASDGFVTSNVATVSVSITAVNLAPVAQTGVVTTPEGTSVNGTLGATDPDGDAITFSVATQPAQGVVTLVDAVAGTFTYTPSPNAIGYDTFTFTVEDSSGLSTSATQMVFIVASSPRWPGQTVRVSVASDGAEANDVVGQHSIDASGRYVVFVSLATNLVPGDTNNRQDSFLHDRSTGLTRRISLSSQGGQANQSSFFPSISADGSTVAFTSDASNLDGSDPNLNADVFVHDVATGSTTRVTSILANGSSSAAAVSANGRFVAFESLASNLVGDDGNNARDIFLFDRLTTLTRRVSVGSGGIEANGASQFPAISASGRYVAFSSTASNLVSGDTNGSEDVFVYDIESGQTTRVSVGVGGAEASGLSRRPSLSPDGSLVVFESAAANLVPSDTNNNMDVFVRDRTSGVTRRVSVGSGATQADFGGGDPRMSADGRFVAFSSGATNLVPGDTNNAIDVFVNDTATSRTTRLNVTPTGAQANEPVFSCCTPQISADGRFVAFDGLASTYVSGDTNGRDIVVVGGVRVTPSSASVTGAGGTGTVEVEFTYPGTIWTATSNDSWISITNQSSPNGSGAVSYTVAPNATGTPRTGTLTVATQTVTVSQAARLVPVVTWPTPAAIVYGTSLSAVQLNASAAVPGVFVYSPSAGTVPNAGANQPLSVTFTPTDTASYESVTVSNSITILPRPTNTILSTWPNPSVVGNPVALNALVNFAFTGLVRFTSSLTGDLGTVSLLFDDNAILVTSQLTPGTHVITATFLGTTNLEPSTSSPVTHVVNPQGTQFLATTPVATGFFPRAIAVGDVNGDGRADAMALNAGDNTLTVLLASTSGALVAGPTVPTGSNPVAAATADFNGDGRLDVAIANQNDRNIGVLMGNGDGTFQPMLVAPVANVPRSVSAADLNADGRVDLVVPHSTCCAFQVGVLLANGDGTFQPSVDYAAEAGGVAAVGDVNGDSAPDIAFASGTQVRLLLNLGDGTFQSGATYALPDQTMGLLVRELSGDGQNDLAVLTFSDGISAVRVFLGHGDGTFASPVSYAAGFGSVAIDVLDVEQDAALDLVVTNRNDRTVSVLRGNGNGTFQAAVPYVAGVGPTGVGTGDVNGDGSTDFVVSHADSDTVIAFLNRRGTLVTIESSLNPSQLGQSVTVIARVEPTLNLEATPEGTVTFRNGLSVLGTLPVSGGQASLVVSTLSTGAHSLTASYSGDGNLNPSEAQPLIQTVLAAPLTVSVVAPNGGERVFANVPTTIRWTGSGVATSFDVELSRNSGGTFTPIPACTALPGTATSCTWTPTGPGSTTVRIRVTARNNNGTATDASDADFTISTATPSVTVTRPNTALSLVIGSADSIRWNHNLGLQSFVRVELSRDGGTSWEVLAASFQNTGATSSIFPWAVTGPVSSAALIRVTWLDGPTSDVSNVAFSIVRPTINVTAPNTAVAWTLGTPRTITWTHNMASGQLVNLDVSRDGGVTWNSIATSVANASATSGTFDWVVTGPATSTARVRASWASDTAANDASNVNFSIVTPSIAVTAPNSAVTWRAGNTQTLRFTHNLGAGQPVAFDVSRDGGSSWTPIISLTTTTSNAVTYAWVVSGPPTPLARIRARWTSDPGVFDVSDVNFAIISRITVTAPNTAVTWGAGSTRQVTWTHNLGLAETVNIDVSPDGGATWVNVAAGVANATATSGSFAALMPSSVTTQALVRVSQTTDPTSFDTSDLQFTLAAPVITVTAPNTNVNWPIGSTRSISWSHNLGTGEAVEVALSRDNGATWARLTSALANTANTTGTFSWVVTGPATTTGRVRVTWMRNGAVQDVSNVAFRIQ